MLELLQNFQRFRKALLAAFKEKCRQLDLDPRQAVLLKALDDLGPSSAVDLCRATLCDPATANRAVAAMVKRGWISRRKDPRDGRCSVLALKEGEGLRLARGVGRQYAQLAREAFRPFSGQERRRLNRDLTRLTQHMDRGLAGRPAKRPLPDTPLRGKKGRAA